MEWLERELVFFPERMLAGTPRDLDLPFEDVVLTTSDGVRIHGWYVPSPNEKIRLVFFHGNGGNISSRMHHLREYAERGISTLMIDYRGYGKSDGVPSELGLYADAEAALAWINARVPADIPVAYYGESLGSAVAVDLAANVALPHKLVLEGGFTSARDMAKVMYSFLGSALPLKYEFDSVTKIRKITCPLLSIHGERDDVVPFRLGRALYDAHPGPKAFLVVPEAHHNDLLSFAGVSYYDRLSAFLLDNP